MFKKNILSRDVMAIIKGAKVLINNKADVKTV